MTYDIFAEIAEHRAELAHTLLTKRERAETLRRLETLLAVTSLASLRCVHAAKTNRTIAYPKGVPVSDARHDASECPFARRRRRAP